MKQINRRQWLRYAGLAGAATLVGNQVVHSQQPVPKVTNEQTAKGIGAIIRLNSNENPYGPSQKVRTAMIEGFKNACRYPGSFEDSLLTKLSEKHKIPKDHILLTAGSKEGLRAVALTYADDDSEIVAADPVYNAMLTYSENQGVYVHRVPLTDKLTHDLSAMKSRMTANTRLVYLCNPSNPTGTLLNSSQFQRFTSDISEKAIVLADEAYFDYITATDYISAIHLVKKGLNVVVARTFSKVYGLAGLRIGYLIARPDIIARIDKNVMARPNILALYAAEAALEDKEFYKESLQKNKAGKELLYSAFKKKGLEYIPSHTNFVFFKTGRDIQEIIPLFMKHGIKVGRPFSPLDDWCRVSIGKLNEMEAFVKAMDKVFI